MVELLLVVLLLVLIWYIMEKNKSSERLDTQEKPALQSPPVSFKRDYDLLNNSYLSPACFERCGYDTASWTNFGQNTVCN